MKCNQGKNMMTENMKKRNYSKEIAKKSLKKAIEQMDEYNQTKKQALLSIAYANAGFASWYGLDTKKEIKRLKNYGVNVKDIKNWKPARKINEKHFGIVKGNKSIGI